MAHLVFENEDITVSRGPYAGEKLSDVADEDPNWLRWVLENGDITHQERTALEEALGLD